VPVASLTGRTAGVAPVGLPAAEWLDRVAAHTARADELTAAHRGRVATGQGHPVEDFLFTYYSLTPARLRRWHPGVGVVLLGDSARRRLDWRWYGEVGIAGGGVGVGLDLAAYQRDRGDLVRFVGSLLSATADRPAQVGCFGLHEWAMVYRQRAGDVRHADWPLRLGSAGTDEVVESAAIRCTHYDAYRFFRPEALGRNAVRPTRDSQPALEQPGCLHANMDLYKWAYKLGPLVPGELLLDCFELARDVRELDMRASPYDLTALGYEPVRIETTEGRAEHVAAQRAFAARTQPLRLERLEVCGATASGRLPQNGSGVPAGRL
jgi:hypothetical protein